MVDMEGGYLANLRDAAIFATVASSLNNELAK